jgi:hypothetical protein
MKHWEPQARHCGLPHVAKAWFDTPSVLTAFSKKKKIKKKKNLFFPQKKKSFFFEFFELFQVKCKK